MTKKQPNVFVQMGWRVLLDGLSRGSFFVVTILIARALSVQDFGRYNYIISLAMIFYSFTDLGTHLQMNKELGENRTSRPELWLTYWKLKITLLALSFVVFTTIFLIYPSEIKASLFMMAYVWMLGNSILDFCQFVCNGLAKLKVAQNLIFIHRGFQFVGVGLPLLLTPTIENILWGLSLGSFLGALWACTSLFKSLKEKPSFEINIPEWKRILSLSLPNAIGGLFGNWNLRMGIIFLSLYWGVSIVGEYSAAFRIYEMAYLIPAALLSVGVPHLSEALYARDSRFLTDFKNILFLVIILGSLCLGFLYFCAPWIISLFFGDRYLNSILILRIFAFAGFLVFINYFLIHMMVVVNRQKRHAFHEGVVFFSGLIFLLLLVPRRGGGGAALSLLFMEIVLFILTAGYLFFYRKILFNQNPLVK